MISARRIIESVNIFLTHRGKYLLLHRSSDQEIDPGKYNGVGGRVILGETYLDTAVRKIEEETGYQLPSTDLKLIGIAREEGCPEGDWLIAYYTAEVPDPNPPLGYHNEAGDLEWLDPREVLNRDIIADLKTIFPVIIKNQGIFHALINYDSSASRISSIKIN